MDDSENENDIEQNYGSEENYEPENIWEQNDSSPENSPPEDSASESESPPEDNASENDTMIESYQRPIRRRYVESSSEEEDIPQANEKRLERYERGISKRNNNINEYLTDYQDDGVNKRAVYESTIERPEMQGEARLTLKESRKTQGFTFEAKTTYARGHQPEIPNNEGERQFLVSSETKITGRRRRRRNGEERQRRREIMPEKEIPQLTMGMLYIQQIDEEEDIIPETKHEIKEEIPQVQLTQVIDELMPEAEYLHLLAEIATGNRYKNDIVEGKNGEEGNLRANIEKVRQSTTTPGSYTNATAETAGKSSILRKLLERTSSKDVDNTERREEVPRVPEKINNINNKDNTKMILTRDETWSDTNATCNDSSYLFSDNSHNSTITIKTEDSIGDHLHELNNSFLLDSVEGENHGDYSQEHQPENWTEEEIRELWKNKKKIKEKTYQEDSPVTTKMNQVRHKTKTAKTCRKKTRLIKLNRIRKRRRMRREMKRLKVRVRFIKICHRQYLKKYLRLVRAMKDEKIKEMSSRVVKNDKKNDAIPRKSTIRKVQIVSPVVMTQRVAHARQTEEVARPTRETACGAEANDEAVNLEHANVTHREIDSAKLTLKRYIETMEKLERELINKYVDKCERRYEEERRRTRYEHIKRMVDEMPILPDIPDDTDHEVERMMNEIQTNFNKTHNEKRMFRIYEEVDGKSGEQGAVIDANLYVRMIPSRINIDKEVIMLTVLIKGQDVRSKARLLRDMNIEDIDKLQVKIPGLRYAETNERQSVTTNETNIPTGEGETPDKTVPEAMSEVDPPVLEPEDESASTAMTTRTNTPEVTTVSETIEIPEDKRKEISMKEVIKTYKRKRSKVDYKETKESEDEGQNEESETKRKINKNKSEKAKDGRARPDVSGRERSPTTGRLKGYKKGFGPKGKRSRCKLPAWTPTGEEIIPKIKKNKSVPDKLETTTGTEEATQFHTSTPRPEPAVMLHPLSSSEVQQTRSMEPIVPGDVPDLTATVLTSPETPARHSADLTQSATQRQREEQESRQLTE